MNSPFANVSIQHSVADANGRGSITWTRVNGERLALISFILCSLIFKFFYVLGGFIYHTVVLR